MLIKTSIYVFNSYYRIALKSFIDYTFQKITLIQRFSSSHIKIVFLYATLHSQHYFQELEISYYHFFLIFRPSAVQICNIIVIKHVAISISRGEVRTKS